MEDMRNMIPDWELAEFVGENQEYYARVWRGRDPNNYYASWNWGAFFFGPLWLIYRKMYTQTGWMLLISMLLSYVPLEGLPKYILSMIPTIMISVFGNAIYHHRALFVLQNCKNFDDNKKHLIYKRVGGTHILSAVIAGLIVTIFLISDMISAGII